MFTTQLFTNHIILCASTLYPLPYTLCPQINCIQVIILPNRPLYNPYSSIPKKHMNEIPIRPVTMNAMPKPLRGAGTFE